MIIDYREFNKGVPPLFVAVPNTTGTSDKLAGQANTYQYVVD